MASYRLTEAAKVDLRRIYHYGVVQFGKAQADKYFDALFERFEQIVAHPLQYTSVEYIRVGYRRSLWGVDSILYRVVNDTVDIISVLSRQDIDRFL
jgi:toxin ParE1/3/4